MEETWVPFSARPEWDDIEPVSQDDGPKPVVAIMYTRKFREVMDYFRAILAKDERSPRALALTKEVISVNAANYTVWQFRRLVLKSLDANLEDERAFIKEVAATNHKNYQIWHHRRWVAENIGVIAVDGELEFTKDVLNDDAKNYHAWSHRQWVLRTLGGWEGELDYCRALLEDDIYNNSAWNQRFFVITRSPILGDLIAMRDQEVNYCIQAINSAPDNESSWRYLRGLFNDDPASLVQNSEVTKLCVGHLAINNNCIQALNFLTDLLSIGLHLESADLKMMNLGEGMTTIQALACVCKRLETVDPIRSQYWAWRRHILNQA